jgi:HlyD family secretion protein
MTLPDVMNSQGTQNPGGPLPQGPVAGDQRRVRRDMLAGGVVAAAFFVGFLGWAALVPLQAAVYAPGVIAVAGNRQSVQHREGGIVSALYVQEGQRVIQGQPLAQVSIGDARATERALAGQYLTLVAQRARLEAEQRRLPALVTPAEFTGLSADDAALAGEALRLQQLQFSARRRSLLDQKGVLNQRELQLRQQTIGFQRQLTANDDQQRLISDELEGVRKLNAQGYAPVTRIRQLERQAADLRGQLGSLTSQVGRTNEAVGETRMQGMSLEGQFLEGVAEELRTVQVAIDEAGPRLRAARAEVSQATIRAPATGQVVGLTAFTVGGVIGAGQTLAEIVPENRDLVIQAHISPRDADDIQVGQDTEIRFSSLHEKRLPLLHGRVTKLSADSVTNDAGDTFFRAEISVSAQNMRTIQGLRGTRPGLRPGLPVEVVVPLRSRTALTYLLEPLTGVFWRSFGQN